MSYIIQQTTKQAIPQLFHLYKEVAEKSGGIIRRAEEISMDYIENFISHSLESGLAFMAIDTQTDEVLGEIHAYQTGLKAFEHLLENLTIVVHPSVQNKGIGKSLFIHFLEAVRQSFQHILKVELYVREQNTKAVKFYQSLGFVIEGRLTKQILNADGTLETPLMMSWFNPQSIYFKKEYSIH